MAIMVEKISAVTFRVSNMKASVQFYREVLGMELLYGGETAGFSSLRAKDANSAILNLEQGKPVVNTVPQAKFGLAFNESSGPCLTRAEGNDDELRNAAIANAQALACGHVFILILRDAYPINLLNVVQNIPEVCSIFCATTNPVEVIVAKNKQGRGVMGVIDGSPPKGVEGPAEINARKEFLRKIGYKR